MKERIAELKQQKNAVILAHYYQESDIQDVADFIGDSFELSRKAVQTDADIIVFAGVRFMAETAAILNPDKIVLLPDLEAGCSLEESCPPEQFAGFIARYPDHLVLTYVNCSPEIKAMSDILCTSSNAEKILNTIPLDQPVIFAPDRNLGEYLKKKTGRQMLIWDGACIVHEAFSSHKLQELKLANPDASVIAHPEAQAHILEMADFIGSTSGMLAYVKAHPDAVFIVATEAGILHEMEKHIGQGRLIPAPVYENNACACSECPYMKVNTLEKLLECLETGVPSIHMSEYIRKKALIPLQKMLQLTA